MGKRDPNPNRGDDAPEVQQKWSRNAPTDTSAAADKKAMREHYKALGNKKERGKTQKGGTGHWEAQMDPDW